MTNVRNFSESIQEVFDSTTETHPANSLKLEFALLVDAVDLFTSALAEVETSTKFQELSLLCNTTDNWAHGDTVINFMKTVIMSYVG